ncbi:MAG: PD-(D/E)XK nuclease family protein [Chloroflexi bacterium]|nr:PD-(D/E)XK nuclease family protein [Chloroflexota bacterium]
MSSRSASSGPKSGRALRLSFSKLARYQHCPHAYYLGYVERHRPAFSAWPFFGSLIHKVLEDLFGRTRDRAASWEWLRDRFEERLEGSYGFLVSSDAADFRARGLEILGRFWREHRPAVGHGDLLEERFRAQIGGFDVSGVIDRIEIRPGRTRIVDYKSGRSGGSDHDFRQLEFYALAADRSLGRQPDAVAYHFLGDGVVLEREPTADSLAATEQWARDLGQGIARADFEPRQGRHCPNCDFFRVCEPGRSWQRANRAAP